MKTTILSTILASTLAFSATAVHAADNEMTFDINVKEVCALTVLEDEGNIVLQDQNDGGKNASFTVLSNNQERTAQVTFDVQSITDGLKNTQGAVNGYIYVEANNSNGPSDLSFDSTGKVDGSVKVDSGVENDVIFSIAERAGELTRGEQEIVTIIEARCK